MHTPRGERQQADGTEVAGTSEPLLIVHIRPDLGSFLRAAWISAFLASVVLMWGLARLDDIQDPDRSDAVTTLLLLVPSLLSFYLLRPGEHRLVRKALVGSRIAVLMAGCASLMAALSTATGVEGERLRILWTITLGCAILGLAALTAANRWRNPEKPVVRER
jgi:drug/metabolite transporter (DMT)-like permease